MENKYSDLHFLSDTPKDPMDLFKKMVDEVPIQRDSKILMNLATIDEEYGVLNRSLIYRGLFDNCVTFVTQNDSKKYKNIAKMPKVAISFLLTENEGYSRQIRINGSAEELSGDAVKNLWNKEPLFAKIRTIICESGKPIIWHEEKAAHDKLLQEVNNGKVLEQPTKYTAFKVVPQMMDFYESSPNSIADRVQYRKNTNTAKWEQFHVAA